MSKFDRSMHVIQYTVLSNFSFKILKIKKYKTRNRDHDSFFKKNRVLFGNFTEKQRRKRQIVILGKKEGRNDHKP